MPSERLDGRSTGPGAHETRVRGEKDLSRRLRAMEGLRPVTGRRLLDVGCGNGAYTMRMARRFQQSVGIDPDADRISDFGTTLVAAGSAAPSITVLLGSAAELPHPEQHFEVVTLIETLEHLGARRDETLREIARVTALGGTMYLTTPNRWWPFEQHGFRTRTGWKPGWKFPFLPWVPALHRRFSVNDAFTPWRLDGIIEPFGFRRTGLAFIPPPLDGHPRLRRAIAPAFTVARRTPLRRFCQTLVMTYERI